ncbi:MAG: protein-glutamate O-methyltransferase CheR [Geobacteraceae bacterium]|nr:protein-glutamate O-methyltransferase CheR [Geobacteraceae bacterium]
MRQSANRTFPASADLPEISAEAFDMILRLLKELKGFNLDIYKDKCIKRRIAIRIRKTCCSSAAEYGELLMRDKAEPDHLLKVLTIHVSHFFRNPSTFQKLKDEIFPYLFSLCERETRESLKLWSVGCAGGEEPYSACLLLKEYFAETISRREVAILGSDVNPEILETAKKGIYREERLLEVPREIRDRWFTPEEGRFQLAPEIMAMVTFRQSDLCDIDIFPESDLILCRNVLIYLERSHQEKILCGFADALRAGGILVLGKAETLVGESRKRFRTVCPVERIYRVI